MSDKRYDGWHFLCASGCMMHDRNSEKVVAGTTYHCNPPIELCRRGLHASAKAIDALGNAPGPIVCRVMLTGMIVTDNEKAAASERTVLAMADATKLLHEFACWCAEKVLYLCEDQDTARKAIETKRAWLRGEATDHDLAAARASARVAVMNVPWDASRDVAWASAEAVARAVASATAGDIARDVSWASAWASAWTASWAITRNASRASAWDVAWDSAWDAQNKKLESELSVLLGVPHNEDYPQDHEDDPGFDDEDDDE